MVERYMPLFAPRARKVLRYSDIFGMGATSGAITLTQIFRANDLYDPDYSSTGHQPMGFDQMMVFYNHFTVTRAKLTCNFSNTASSTPTVCVRVDGDLTAQTVYSRILELGNCVTEILEYKGTMGSSKQLTMEIDVAKLQGVTQKTILADANLRGSASASPTEITYIHVTCWDPTGVTSSATCQFTLEQEAVFYEPRDITQSLVKRAPVEEKKHPPEVLSSPPPTPSWEKVSRADSQLTGEQILAALQAFKLDASSK